jgi:hypothetical protein
MNKWLFLGAFLLVPAAALLGIAGVSFLSEGAIAEIIAMLLSEGVLALIGMFVGVFYLFPVILFHYRMWAAIYDRGMRISPGLAVVLLFVPVVNLFWIFRLYPGFVRSYNEQVEKNHTALPRLEPSAYQVFPTMLLISVILGFVTLFNFRLPLVEIVVGLIAYVYLLIVVSRTCDAVNRLADAVEGGS